MSKKNQKKKISWVRLTCLILVILMVLGGATIAITGLMGLL